MRKLTSLQIEILIIVFMMTVTLTVGEIYIKNIPNDHGEVIRFHVIANSDSEEDQSLKLKVRDGILTAVETDIASEVVSSKGNTIDLTRAYINRNIGDINNLAEKIIRDNGYDYTVRSKLGVTYIPEKTYGDISFPAGNYEVLNITIGAGNGQNWWCVLFPPLCLIDSKEHIYSDQLNISEEDGIVLKSKVAEIVKKYRSDS